MAPSYWQRLKSHPGPPWATGFSGLFLWAAWESGGSIGQWVMSGTLAALTWSVVLWTATTQPVAEASP